MRGLATAVFIALAAAAAEPAAAQQRDTTLADSARSFVRGGIYDKPWLARQTGRAAIGGYAEAHARYEREDGIAGESGLVAKRFNLFAHARVSEVVRFAAELEIEDGGEVIKLEFAAIDVSVHRLFTLRGGMILSPVGRFNLSHDSPLNEFTDRPLPATELIGVALSEPGLGAFGTTGAGRTGRLTWEAYLTNGFHDGVIASGEGGTRIPMGRGNHHDNNASPAMVGRVAWSPRVGAELGASAHRGAYNVFSEGGLDVDERRDVRLSAIDAEWSAGGIAMNAEFVWARADVPEGLRGLYAERQRGGTLELVGSFGQGWLRTLPASRFAWKLRAEAVDFDRDVAGDDVRQLSVGVNFRPGEDTVLKLDYVRGRSHDRFAVAAEHARILFSLATYF